MNEIKKACRDNNLFKTIININFFTLFYIRFKYLSIFAFMITGRLNNWSWRSSSDDAVKKAIV